MDLKTIGIPGYKKMLENLLPVGYLWRQLGETFSSLIEAKAAGFSRLHDRIMEFIDELNPVTSTELLEDYERIALLPDEMPVTGDTLEQRRQVVAAKFSTHRDGPQKQSFIDIAAELGMTITVEDVNDGIDNAMVARVDEARVDDDRVSEEGDIFNWQITVVDDPNSQQAKFEIMVERLKPKHTRVTYI